jgi:hypothetical protein
MFVNKDTDVFFPSRSGDEVQRSKQVERLEIYFFLQ